MAKSLDGSKCLDQGHIGLDGSEGPRKLGVCAVMTVLCSPCSRFRDSFCLASVFKCLFTYLLTLTVKSDARNFITKQLVYIHFF